MSQINLLIENLITDNSKISDKTAEYFHAKCLQLIDLWQKEQAEVIRLKNIIKALKKKSNEKA